MWLWYDLELKCWTVSELVPPMNSNESGVVGMGRGGPRYQKVELWRGEDIGFSICVAPLSYSVLVFQRMQVRTESDKYREKRSLWRNSR